MMPKGQTPSKQPSQKEKPMSLNKEISEESEKPQIEVSAKEDEMPQEGDVEKLIADLKNPDKDVRKSAAEALGKIGDEQAVNPLLASLEGRSTDVIVTKSRGKISGNFLFYPAYPTFAQWGVEQYQIIQEDYENILIKIVPGKEFHTDVNEIRKLMVEAYQKILGGDMKIDVRLVDEITATAAGKRKFIISNVA